MILIDTSAWIEFLRDTGSPVCESVDAALDGQIAICDVISMELLAGARSDRHLAELRGLIGSLTRCPIDSLDYEMAALMYRNCRSNGETVRKLIDCVIAAVAVRLDCEVLHADADFAVLGRHTGLRIHPASQTG